MFSIVRLSNRTEGPMLAEVCVLVGYSSRILANDKQSYGVAVCLLMLNLASWARLL